MWWVWYILLGVVLGHTGSQWLSYQYTMFHVINRMLMMKLEKILFKLKCKKHKPHAHHTSLQNLISHFDVSHFLQLLQVLNRFQTSSNHLSTSSHRQTHKHDEHKHCEDSKQTVKEDLTGLRNDKFTVAGSVIPLTFHNQLNSIPDSFEKTSDDSKVNESKIENSQVLPVKNEFANFEEKVNEEQNEPLKKIDAMPDLLKYDEMATDINLQHQSCVNRKKKLLRRPPSHLTQT